MKNNNKYKNILEGGNRIKRKKSKPFISIVVPNLNNSKGLDKTLKSVFAQKRKNYEVIVVDGGSKDNSINILKKFNSKIDYWISRKDKNLWDAMNRGILISKGKVIGILNSSDIYYKNTTKIVEKYFSSQNKIDFLFGSVKKKRVYKGFYPKKITLRFNIYPGHSSGFFIRKDVHKKIGLYDTNLKLCADYDLIYRLIKSNFIAAATKKSEVTGKFDMFGLSSRVSFYKKLKYEMKVRYKNNQNIFIILFIYVSRIIYNFIRPESQ